MAVPTDGNAPLSNPSHMAEHQRISDAVATLSSTPWIALPFAANWSNYGAGYELGAYRKIGDIVYMQGLVVGAVAGSQAITTLPLGYRPKRAHLLICLTLVTGGVLRVDVLNTGVLMTSTAMTAGSWVSLSNVQFSTTGV